MNKKRLPSKNKFRHAGFPIRFTESVIRQFEEKLTSQLEEEDLIIPEFLFREPSKFVLVEIPFCDSNEHLVKRFLEKVKDFTGNKVDFGIKWLTKKVKHLFHVKDRNPHQACKIYEGICTCKENYIGETKRNVETRWKEHQNINKDSEPAKHLREYPTHSFEWKIILNAPNDKRTRKNIEASVIALKRPFLNDQLNSQRLILLEMV